MKDVVFCTFITQDYKDSKIEFDLFYKSFKAFHPEAELVVFEDEDIKKIKSENNYFSFINWKSSLAKKFYNDYKTVVVLDTDHFFFSRLDEIFDLDYDVAVPINHNIRFNVGLKLAYYLTQDLKSLGCVELVDLVLEDEFYQAGLIAGNKHFWQTFDFACEKFGNKIGHLGENVVLNLILSLFPWNLKILDGSKRISDPDFKYFYGISGNYLESNFHIFDDKVFCGDKQVKLYHIGRGGNGKIRFEHLFNSKTKNWFYSKIV